MLHHIDSFLRDRKLERRAELGMRAGSWRPRFLRREVKPLAGVVEIARPIECDGSELSRAA
jgi:hypothetical protein